jgi:hypothetical protein
LISPHVSSAQRPLGLRPSLLALIGSASNTLPPFAFLTR